MKRAKLLAYRTLNSQIPAPPSATINAVETSIATESEEENAADEEDAEVALAEEEAEDNPDEEDEDPLAAAPPVTEAPLVPVVEEAVAPDDEDDPLPEDDDGPEEFVPALEKFDAKNHSAAINSPNPLSPANLVRLNPIRLFADAVMFSKYGT